MLCTWSSVVSLLQDYEFQILAYKALQDPIASPLKKPKMESASDNVIQEVGVRSRMNPSVTDGRLTARCRCVSFSM